MNGELQKMHVEAIRHKSALLAYRSMCRDYKKEHGTLSAHAELLIYNIASLQDMMDALRDDLASNGTIKTVRNGKQTFTQTNKSLGDISRLMERQARLIARLGLKHGDADTAGEGDNVEEGLENF